MIDRQRHIGSAAVLTSMTIAPKDVLPGQNDFFERDTDVDRKANDARERHRHRDGVQVPAVKSGNQFSFTKIEEDNRFLDIANAEWLVVLV